VAQWLAGTRSRSMKKSISLSKGRLRFITIFSTNILSLLVSLIAVGRIRLSLAWHNRMPLPRLRSTAKPLRFRVFADIFVRLTQNNSCFKMQQQTKLASIAGGAINTKTLAVRTVDVQACGQYLANGGLVAFPTETVYGLGCDASNPEAIQAVFLAKERPLTDPLIVHVLHPNDAYPLWKATSFLENADSGKESRTTNTHLQREGLILQSLCESFWPGPLTLVASASPDAFSTVYSSSPSEPTSGPSALALLTAGTGYVAVRSPRHGTARAVLEASGRPIAAPSANKFGHVSPTTADHVWDDLQNENVWILQGGESDLICCDVGVESTVVKVECTSTIEQECAVTILRQGAVSLQDISSCLESAGLLVDLRSIVLKTETTKATSEKEARISPGQTLRHYSPNVPSFLVGMDASGASLDDGERRILASAVVIDYAGQLSGWQSLAIAYRDLSSSSDSKEAAQNVFETLRWAENVPGVRCILFPDRLKESSSDTLALALQDRLTRAASGVVLNCLFDTRATGTL
jgi:L-threonylcarbamoyladenylate synthase